MTTALLAPDHHDVWSVVEQVWASYLDPESSLLPAAAGAFPVGWSATVTVSGGWDGLVAVELPAAAAEALTRTMLGLADTDEVADEDVADAVGELVNMVGGNVKSLMPGPSTLSLPVVAAGRVARPSDTAEVCRLDATWGGQPVAIGVHAMLGHPGSPGGDR